MENELTKKKCKACLEEKELCEFSRDKYCDDGYVPKCKLCKKNKIPIIKENNIIFKVCSICDKRADSKTFTRDLVEEGNKTVRCRACVNLEKRVVTNTYKICTLCKNTKDKIFFSLDRHSPDGYSYSCLECRQNKVRVIQEDISDGFKTCSKCNISKTLDLYSKNNDCRNNINSKCRDCTNEYNNTPKQKERRKKYRELKKDYMKVYLKEYNLLNNDKLTEQKRIYYKKNKKAINDFKNQWVKNKRLNDLLFKLYSNIRHSISEAIKRNKSPKDTTTVDILGCTIEEFKQHIESQFLPWMSWDNYGNVCGDILEYNCSWDLDHIIPINWASTKEEVICLNHWSNFQPLCSKVNRWEKRAEIYPCCNIELNLTVF